MMTTFSPYAKPQRWKSKKYESWVRQLGCCICGNEGEVHHAKGIGNLSGVGLKAPSWAVMCLCRYHHDSVQSLLIDKDQQLIWICKTLGRAINEGIIELSVNY